MIALFSPRGLGAAALVAGLLLAGCSSDSDVPPTVASAPGGGTQVNTDTGSGGNFPDINTVPDQRPTSTIQDLNQLPQGLSAAQGGTQYGEALVGGPTSSAEPPAPPPPPQEELPPLPEPGIKTRSTGAPREPTTGEPVAAAEEPIATPEVVEPQAMEPMAEATPEPAATEPAAPQEGIVQDTDNQEAPQIGEGESPPVAAAPQVEPAAQQPSAPEPIEAQPVDTEPLEAQPPEAQPTAPAGTPQPGAPLPPQSQVAGAPVQNAPPAATQQAQLPGSAPGAGAGATAPEAYGITPPQPSLPPYRGNPAQNGVASAAPIAAGPAAYGQPYGGQPIGLIYFREGSAELSSDDRNVLEQVADLQRAYGGVVNVVGHASMHAGTTDYVRHQQANLRISEARANAVALQLMEYGVPLGAIRAAAVGDSQPLYSEAMPSGEAGNRRVEVYLSAY